MVLYTARALYAYDPDAENAADDLPLAVDEIIEVLEEVDADWLRGQTTDGSRMGFFPRAFVERMEQQETVDEEPAVSEDQVEPSVVSVEQPIEHTTQEVATKAETGKSETGKGGKGETNEAGSSIDHESKQFKSKMQTFASQANQPPMPIPSAAISNDSYMVRKPFAGVEHKSSYVPPSLGSVKKPDHHAEERKPDVVSGSKEVEVEEGPRMTLKERMMKLQKQQQEEQEALATALKRKEERKKSAEHKLRRSSSVTSDTAKSATESTDLDTELANVNEVEEQESGLQEEHLDKVDEKAVTDEDDQEGEEGNDGEEEEGEEEEYDEEEEEELRRRNLAARMAKLSGGMGMMGMMGMPMAPPISRKPKKAVEPKEDPEIAQLPKAIPILPYASPLPPQLGGPEAQAGSDGEEEEREEEVEQPVKADQDVEFQDDVSQEIEVQQSEEEEEEEEEEALANNSTELGEEQQSESETEDDSAFISAPPALPPVPPIPTEEASIPPGAPPAVPSHRSVPAEIPAPAPPIPTEMPLETPAIPKRDAAPPIPTEMPAEAPPIPTRAMPPPIPTDMPVEIPPAPVRDIPPPIPSEVPAAAPPIPSHGHPYSPLTQNIRTISTQNHAPPPPPPPAIPASEPPAFEMEPIARSTTGATTFNASKELSTSHAWWLEAQLPPELSPSSTYFETQTNTIPRRSFPPLIVMIYYTIDLALNTRMIELAFDQSNPTELVHFRETKSKFKLDRPALKSEYIKYGSQVYSLAMNMFKQQSAEASVDSILDQLDVLPSIGNKTFGAVVYKNTNGDSSSLDDIRKGDIIVLLGAHFSSGLTTGINGPQVSVVTSWDKVNSQAHAVEQTDSGFKEAVYDFGELVKGKIRVFRVIGRDCIGW